MECRVREQEICSRSLPQWMLEFQSAQRLCLDRSFEMPIDVHSNRRTLGLDSFDLAHLLESCSHVYRADIRPTSLSKFGNIHPPSNESYASYFYLPLSIIMFGSRLYRTTLPISEVSLFNSHRLSKSVDTIPLFSSTCRAADCPDLMSVIRIRLDAAITAHGSETRVDQNGR